MQKTALFVCFLALFVTVFCFDEYEQDVNFLDSQPHPLIRTDFFFPEPAVMSGDITIKMVADLGYYLDFVNGPQKRYLGSSESFRRNVQITLKSPSGNYELDLGTFFDQKTNNNGNYIQNSLLYVLNGGNYEIVTNTKDYGYYNTIEVLEFTIPDNLWIPITKEGFASIFLEFSPDVASHYKFYPQDVQFHPNYAYENFLSVRVSFSDAGAIGDPHFFGWNGHSFDFQGENHHIYNLISHREVSINFQMKQRSFFSVGSMEEMDSLSHNTYIGTLGFETKTHQLLAYSGEGGFEASDAGYIVLDGVRHKIVRDDKEVFSDNEITVEWVRPSTDFFRDRDPIAATLRVTTSIFTVTTHFIEYGRKKTDFNDWHSHPFRYFDVFASITEKEVMKRGRIHGVLGQTGDAFLSSISTGEREWRIEGEFEDYRVNDLFDHDFKFNLFRKN